MRLTGIIGVIGGTFGGLTGLGGAVVSIPLLTTFAKFTQIQASGTCVFGALATGIFGTTAFYYHGKKIKNKNNNDNNNNNTILNDNNSNNKKNNNNNFSLVDVPTALVLALSAAVVAPIAARVAVKLPEQQLLKILGSISLLSGGLVVIKPFFSKYYWNQQQSLVLLESNKQEQQQQSQQQEQKQSQQLSQQLPQQSQEQQKQLSQQSQTQLQLLQPHNNENNNNINTTNNNNNTHELSLFQFRLQLLSKQISSLYNNNNSILNQSLFNNFWIIGMGILAGISTGMFGVGGGVIMVPAISMLSDQQTALATSLLASLGPMTSSAITHWRLKTTVPSHVLPLVIGSAFGSYVGSFLTVSLSDMEQRTIFCVLMSAVAFRSLHVARKVKTKA